MRTISIANVDYLGGIPYRMLQDPEICEIAALLSYQENLPTENARRLCEGEVDVALIPVADFATHGGFVGLDFGMVLCNQSRIVSLYARQPIESLHSVHLYSGASSSSLLLRLLCRQYYRTAPRFIRTGAHPALDAARDGEGVLVCHQTPLDAARHVDLPSCASTSGLVCEDLAERWTGLTGKPFVFLVWATRVGCLSPKETHQFHRVFHRCVNSLPISAHRYAASFNLTARVCSDLLRSHFRFHLGDAEIDGMQHFFSRAAEAGVAPRAHYQSATVRLFTPGLGGVERRPSVDTILEDVVSGKRLGLRDAAILAEQASLADLGIVADVVRRRLFPDRVIRYVVTVREASQESGLELCKRLEAGGLLGVTHICFVPNGEQLSDLGFYERMLYHLKSESAAFIEGFSVPDILRLSRLSCLPVEEVVSRLITAGLDLMSGAGGGMLLDGAGADRDGQGSFAEHPARSRSHMASVKADDWLKIMRWVHRYGARSSCCMSAHPHLTWEQRLLHLSKLRSLQDEDPGFRYFSLEPASSVDSPADTDTKLRMQMLSRVFLDNVPCFQETSATVAEKSSLLGLAVAINEIRIDIDSKNTADSETILNALSSIKLAGMDFQSRPVESSLHGGIH